MSNRETTRLICPLTASTISQMFVDMEQAASLGADTVECRLDFLDKIPTCDDLAELLTDAPIEVIATCRARREGGRFAGNEDDRLEILRCAAKLGAKFADVEMDVPEADWPDAEIIISQHDFDAVPSNLGEILASQEASAAAINKVAFAAAGPEDALRALDVLRDSRFQKSTMAIAMGEAGLLSRILAGKFGAFGTFAALSSETGSAPGQPTIDEFKNLYRWDSIGPDTRVFGVVGCPVGHSMSPAIHNAAFTAAGVDAVYLPLRIEPGEENFRRFLDAVRDRPWLGLGGLSVTIPHKENAMAYVGAANCDELAVRIGAVNTVTLAADGSLRGDNTDYAAAIDALCEKMGIAREGLAGRAVAVLGAGGAGRAIVAALAHYGAAATIYNRTVSRGEQLAAEFGCDAAGLDALDNLEAEIIINCTPIGMHPKVYATPLATIPPCVKVVFDTIYNPIGTRLLADARAANCLCVSGVDMFVHQAVAQFEIWTGQAAPRSVMRQVVIDHLS